IVALLMLTYRFYSRFLQQARDQGSPSGLVACTEALAGVAVEIFVEEAQVAPVGIVAVVALLALPRPPGFFIRKEDGQQPAANFARHLAQSHLPTRASRTFHLKLVAVVVVIAFQGLDE